MDYAKLGQRIKETRKQRNMSQQELSYEIEYSVPHISMWKMAAGNSA